MVTAGTKAVLERGRVSGRGPALPYMRVRSPNPGPVAVVAANLHGDECTGIGAVIHLSELLPELLTCGEVFLYPSLNPEGLARGIRGLPGDGLDPNRAFPGSSRGSLAQRHAARVWSQLLSCRPDAVVDLHTDAGGAIPYAIVDRVVRGGDREALGARCDLLAQASGLTVLREYPAERYLRYELDQSLPGALVNGPGVAAVTLEIGPRRRLDPKAVRLATDASLGVLTAMGLLERPAQVHETCLAGGPWRRESGPRAKRSGLLLPSLPAGGAFERGDRLAGVYSVEGEEIEVLRATCAGVIVALPESSQIEVGASCATVAVLGD